MSDRDKPITPPGDSMPASLKKGTFFERVRRHFFAGILVIVPLFITIYAIWLIMNIADRVFGDLVQHVFGEILFFPESADLSDRPLIQFARTIVSFFMALLVILFVGYFSTFIFVRRMISRGEAILTRLPLIKFFYNTPKEVLNTFAHSKKNSFKRVVLLEYPRRGIWCLGFATGEVVKRPDDTRLIAVFLPTTPNPTSGFLLLLPTEDVYDTNIPVEDGARLIISGGILAPEHIHTQRFAGLSSSPVLPPLEPLRPSTEIAHIEETGQDAPEEKLNEEENPKEH